MSQRRSQTSVRGRSVVRNEIVKTLIGFSQKTRHLRTTIIDEACFSSLVDIADAVVSSWPHVVTGSGVVVVNVIQRTRIGG